MTIEAAPSLFDWSEAMATKPLDLHEMDALVRQYLIEWEAYETQRKAASALLEIASGTEERIKEALKSAGKRSYKVDGLATVSISQKSVVRVPATIEAKKKFFSYLESLGEGVLLSLATVNSNSLNSWYGKKLDEEAGRGSTGFSVPGIEDPIMRETLSVRNSK